MGKALRLPIHLKGHAHRFALEPVLMPWPCRRLLSLPRPAANTEAGRNVEDELWASGADAGLGAIGLMVSMQ